MRKTQSQTTGVTPKGKKKALEIRKFGNTTMFHIAWTDGGVVPEPLKGLFTDTRAAKSLLDSYLVGQ